MKSHPLMSPKGQPRMEACAIASSSTLTNTVTETAFSNATTYLDGLQPGDMIEIVGACYVASAQSTDTLTVKVYFGTEEICTTGAVNSTTADIVHVHAYIVVTAGGSGGYVRATGTVTNGVEGTATALPFRKASAAETLVGACYVKMTGKWSVAHADNQVACEEWIVIVHRRAG